MPDTPSSSPIVTLQRWELHGGTWRTVSIDDSEATVELCSCTGEAADQLQSNDPELLTYLGRRPRSDAAAIPAHTGAEARAHRSGEQAGMGSFPASDPPSSWTWEIDERT